MRKTRYIRIDMENITTDEIKEETTPTSDNKTIIDEPEKVSAEADNNVNSSSNPKDKKSRGKSILKAVFFAALFGLTFYAVLQITSSLSGGSVASFKQVVSQIKPWYLVAMIGVAAVLFFTDAAKYTVLSKIGTGKFHYGTCFKTAIIGRFYDNITPFNTGGQPFQALYFHKKGFSSDVATSIPVVKYIIQLVSWIFVSLILYIANHSVLENLSDATRITVKVTTYVGIGVACLAPLAAGLFSLFPKLTSGVLAFFIRLGVKIKLVRRPEKIVEKTDAFVANYSEAFRACFKRYSQILIAFIVCVVDFVISMSLPFFVLIAIGDVAPTWKLLYDVITLNAYSLFAASLIPTPGNTGAIETAYSMVFATATPDTSILVYIVFVWRFLTYYIYILFGIIRFIYRFIRDLIRKQRAKKALQGNTK